MKLELKHLAGYLPYGLKVMHGSWKESLLMDCCGNDSDSLSILDVEEYAKPILIPLSDLTKEIEVNGEKFVPLTELLKLSDFDVEKMNEREQLEFLDSFTNTLFMTFDDGQKLLEWHFDIYGLIEKGLAIDINTLNK